MPTLSRISRTILAPAAFCLAVVLAAIPAMAQAAPSAQSPAAAQPVPPAVAKLAQRTARAVAKRKPHSVLIAPGRVCLLNAQLCGERNSALRSALRQLLPGVKFVNWETAVQLLPKYGFLPVDAYFGKPLEMVAGKAGSDVLVTQDGLYDGEQLILTDNAVDTRSFKRIAEFGAEAPWSLFPISDRPVLYRDPDTGASIVVFAGMGTSGSHPAFSYPKCLSCQPPSYPESMRRENAGADVELLATVDKNGSAEDISVAENPGKEFSEAAVQAVTTWKFAPATLGGTPIRVRIPMEVSFRIRN